MRQEPIDDALRSTRHQLSWTRLIAPRSTDVSLGDGVIQLPDPARYKDYRDVIAPQNLLAQFISLRDQQERRFGEFAKKFGPLTLCDKHGLPASHGWDCQASRAEPLDRWRELSRRAYTVLTIRDALNRADRPSPGDWRTALAFVVDVGGHTSWAKQASRRKSFNKFGQSELAVCVQAWLNAVQIGPRIAWNGQSKTYQLELKPSELGPNLFAHLAMQLMLAVADVERLALCSNCGQSYTPTKRPSETRLNFCPRCGRRASVRKAMQRLRKRRSEHSEGLPTKRG
jgi:DNA-directed RNA polymerase subunit RPC12/RpoP